MPKLMLTKATIDRLAQNLQLDADSNVSPTKTSNSLDRKSKFKHLATIDDSQIKRLYALLDGARQRINKTTDTLSDSSKNTSMNLLSHKLLIDSLRLLFERAVRLHCLIPDNCNIVVDEQWRVFSVNQTEHSCQNNCSNCKHSCNKFDETDYSGPLPTLENPAEAESLVNIHADLDQEMFSNLKALGMYLACLSPAEKIKNDEDIAVVFRVNEPVYQAMKQAVFMLTSLIEICELNQGWDYDPDIIETQY